MIHDETSQGAGGDSGDIGGPVGAAAGSSNSGGGSGGRRDAMRKSRQKNKHSKNGGGGSMARRTSQNGSSSAATSGSAAVAVQVVQDSDDSTLSDIGSEDEDGEMFEDSQEELLDFGGGEGCDLPAAVLRKIPRLAASGGNGGGLSRAEGEVVRLIGQYLRNIGLRNSAAVLMTEAGCQLDHSIAATFRKYVMNGEWSGAVTILEELRNHLENPEHAKEMKFLLLEQKYLELLYKGNSIEALKVLQTELTPLKHNQARTHELSSYLMFSSREDLVRVTTTTTAANGSGSGGSLADITDVTTRRNLMDRLQEFLPASIMLPPKRLQTLLNQAAEFQIERCLYHNRPSAAPAGLQALASFADGGCLADPPFTTHLPQNSISPSSNINHHHHSSSNEFKIDPSFLAVDHQCSKEDFPCETIQVLTDHCEEIWYTKFSPDGRRLATGSKDNTVIIWDFDPATLTLKHNKSLERHHAAAFFAWSPDSTRIAVCGPEESDEVFIWNVETGALECKISNATEDSLVTVSWSPDGRRIACGGTRGQFYQCDAKGAVIDSWEGVRVQCLSYRRDGKSVLAADTHHRIRSYNFEDLSDASVLQEDHGIMSFSVDDSDRYALLNVADQGLHMWDIEEKCLVRKFVGVQQGFYTVYSCFGGADQNFIASGSEDHKVYIFHVRREAPIAVLSGHSRTVSCVSWNPVFPQVLVSGSDDGTVRVWAPAEKFRKKRGFSVAAGSGSTGNGSVSNGQDCQNNHNGVV